MENIIGVVIGWILGVLSNPIVNDFAATTKCRRIFLTLKNLLEDLAYYSTFVSRNTEDILRKLLIIKEVMQELDAEKEGILISSELLNQFIERSLPYRKVTL